MESQYIYITFITVLLLSAVHVFSSYLRFLDGPPRSKFLSVAAGISVSFVILRLLPGVNEGQEAILERLSRNSFWATLEQHVYILVLLSFIFFYGAQKYALRSKERRAKKEDDSRPAPKVYRVHITTYAFLNILIGYLLVEMLNNSYLALLFFFVAMLLKFIINDHALHKLHREYYDQKGRWLLSAAVALGWFLSIIFEYSQMNVGFTKAIIAGGALLNVLKEELPEAKESNFIAFAISGIGYAALLILFSG